MDFEKLKIKEYEQWIVYLHQNQYYLGRMYIWARRENALDFMEMNEEEKKELFKIGQELKKALLLSFKPDLINYAILGNVAKHLHIHVIPRYSSNRAFDGIKFTDRQWGKNYAPYNYDFKVPETSLLKIKETIKSVL